MPGDTIISVNGDPVSHWMMFQTWVVTSANKPLELLVERNDERKILSVKPNAEPSVRGDIGVIQVSSRTETIVSHVKEGSLAAQAGIQVGDQIESINGEKLYNVPYFGYGVWHTSEDWRNEKYQRLYQSINGNQEALTLSIRRGNETRTLELPVRWHVKASVQEDSIAQKVGIQDGDVLVALNGTPIDNATLYSELKKMAGGPIEVDVVRDGSPEKVILAAETQSSETDTESALFGLAWQTSLSGMEFDAKTAPLPDYNLFTSFEKGVEATWLTFTAVGKNLGTLGRWRCLTEAAHRSSRYREHHKSYV